MCVTVLDQVLHAQLGHLGRHGFQKEEHVLRRMEIFVCPAILDADDVCTKSARCTKAVFSGSSSGVGGVPG